MTDTQLLDSDRIPTLEVTFLVALFVTSLVTAQLVSSKILEFSIPVLAMTVAMPGGTLAYAGTFLATDCIDELYGEKFAHRVVNVAFFMNFVMLGLVWATIQSPAAPNSIDPQMFETVMGAGTNIVLGSLGAYVVSQNFDVYVFQRVREATGGEYLWLRNIASTAGSQLIDTALFTVIAFWAAPTLFGLGVNLPPSVIVSVIVGQFVGKVIIALLDTPIVYAIVGTVRRHRN